jgi:hypothetical protein
MLKLCFEILGGLDGSAGSAENIYSTGLFRQRMNQKKTGVAQRWQFPTRRAALAVPHRSNQLRPPPADALMRQLGSARDEGKEGRKTTGPQITPIVRLQVPRFSVYGKSVTVKNHVFFSSILTFFEFQVLLAPTYSNSNKQDFCSASEVRER